MGRTRVVTLAAAVLSAALALGCLEFDEQTVYFEHDEANDRLIAVIWYQGLYAGEDTDPFRDREEEAAENLAQAMEKKEVALFANWPTLFDLSESAEHAATSRDLRPDLRDDLLSMPDHVRILNAGFYIDRYGRLCGAQVIVIDQVSELIPRINRFVNEVLLLEPEDESPEETRRLTTAREWARRDHEWLTIEGHRLLFIAPGADIDIDADMAQTQKGFAEWQASRGVDEADDVMGAFFDDPVRGWKEGDVLHVSVGYPAEPCEFVTRPAQWDYEGNLVEHVHTEYGFHLFENAARYVVDPGAPAYTEEEEAAKIIAPRLGPEDRVRALLRGIETNPARAYYEALYHEGEALDPHNPAADLSDEEIVRYWRARLWL
jgi:hypothetical protein